MAEVLLVKPGAVKPADRKALREAGVVVVEVEKPSDAQFMRAGEVVGATDMLWAAMEALCSVPDSSYTKQQRERFATNMFALIVKGRANG